MFRLATRFLASNSFRKQSQQQVYQKMQYPSYRTLMNQHFQRFSTQQEETIHQANTKTESVKIQKKPLRFLLAILVFNGLLGFAYLKKLEYDNRYDFKILMKLLNFKKEYENNKEKYSVEEIKKLFDEFIVENVAITLDEKVTTELRKITQELIEKYPKEREIQMFASQVCEYEKYAMYLKATLVLDRKYIDDVLIRQMALNCERYGKDKPYYFDEFYNACTKYSFDNKQEEADECLTRYLALNPPQYYRAAIQQIKNYKQTGNPSHMLEQIQELLKKEKDLDNKEIEYILSFIKTYPQNEIKKSSDQILAAQILLENASDISLKYVKSVLEKEKDNLQALYIQSQIYSKQQNTGLYNATINQINKINPSFLSSQQSVSS